MCSFNTLSTTGIYIVIFFHQSLSYSGFLSCSYLPTIVRRRDWALFYRFFSMLKIFFAMLKKYSVIKNGKEKFASCGRPHMWIFNNNFIAMSIF